MYSLQTLSMTVVKPFELIVIPNTLIPTLLMYFFMKVRFDDPVPLWITLPLFTWIIGMVPWFVFSKKRVRAILFDDQMVTVREGSWLRITDETSYPRSTFAIRPTTIEGKGGYSSKGHELLSDGSVFHLLHGWQVGWLSSNIARLQEAFTVLPRVK